MYVIFTYGREGVKGKSFLLCFENQLTFLDVSQNTALTNLSCYLNEIRSLDVSQNTALTELWCEDNQLSREQKQHIKAQFPFAEV